MMGDMDHPATSIGRAALRAGVSVVVLALAVSGCTADDPPEDENQAADSVALRVRSVSGTADLGQEARTEAERRVADALSAYIVAGFLGDFPRRDFVPALETFTTGAAETVLREEELEQLTAARIGEEATSVRATDLDVNLSFFTPAGQPLGATAAAEFAFEATMGDGTTRRLTLDGRFLLTEEPGGWAIFGWDTRFDDGEGQLAGSTS